MRWTATEQLRWRQKWVYRDHDGDGRGQRETQTNIKADEQRDMDERERDTEANRLRESWTCKKDKRGVKRLIFTNLA